MSGAILRRHNRHQDAEVTAPAVEEQQEEQQVAGNEPNGADPSVDGLE